MTSKPSKKAASSIDKQGDAAASATQDAVTPVPEGTGTVAPIPAVVTRSQTRAASESPHKLVRSPKKLAASRKDARAGASPSALTRAAHQVASSSYRDVVMNRPRADSLINLEEGEPPRSTANRRLDDVAVEVEGTPSYEPPPTEAQDSWAAVLQDLSTRRAQTEAVETPAVRLPAVSDYVPAPVFREPAGTLGTPNQAHARLELDLTRQWARFPRDMGTIFWEDLFASRRHDVVILYQATIGYTQAENACRSKWLCSKIGRIQIPAELVFDRSFLLEHRDALYLERMHGYLDDRRDRPPILDPEFWLLDLLLEDSQRTRNRLSQIRAEWALCLGFKKIIAFAEYLALHDNADGRARTAYDVCSVPSRDKCTRFICNPAWDELPVLVESWVGVRGLTMKPPKVFYYLGTECVQRKRSKNVDPEKFALTLLFEMVHALACALYVDCRHGQVWLMEESAVVLLENNWQAPEIVIPGGGRIMIGVLAEACRLALAFPESKCSSVSTSSASTVFAGLHTITTALLSRLTTTAVHTSSPSP